MGGRFQCQCIIYVQRRDPGILFIALVACYKGYNAHGGAKGVGQATTEAMVASALGIFILDYFVAVILH